MKIVVVAEAIILRWQIMLILTNVAGLLHLAHCFWNASASHFKVSNVGQAV